MHFQGNRFSKDAVLAQIEENTDNNHSSVNMQSDQNPDGVQNYYTAQEEPKKNAFETGNITAQREEDMGSSHINNNDSDNTIDIDDTAIDGTKYDDRDSNDNMNYNDNVANYKGNTADYDDPNDDPSNDPMDQDNTNSDDTISQEDQMPYDDSDTDEDDIDTSRSRPFVPR